MRKKKKIKKTKKREKDIIRECHSYLMEVLEKKPEKLSQKLMMLFGFDFFEKVIDSDMPKVVNWVLENFNIAKESRTDLFFYGIRMGRVNSVNLILKEHIVKPDVTNTLEYNALISTLTLAGHCPRKKLREMFKVLITGGVDVNARHPITKDTPLHLLARTRFNSRLKKALAFLLVACNADTEAKNKDGKTPVELLHKNTGKEMRDIFSGNIKDKAYVIA